MGLLRLVGWFVISRFISRARTARESIKGHGLPYWRFHSPKHSELQIGRKDIQIQSPQALVGAMEAAGGTKGYSKLLSNLGALDPAETFYVYDYLLAPTTTRCLQRLPCRLPRLPAGPHDYLPGPTTTCHLPTTTCYLPTTTCYRPTTTCYLPTTTCYLPTTTCCLPPKEIVVQ